MSVKGSSQIVWQMMSPHSDPVWMVSVSSSASFGVKVAVTSHVLAGQQRVGGGRHRKFLAAGRQRSGQPSQSPSWARVNDRWMGNPKASNSKVSSAGSTAHDSGPVHPWPRAPTWPHDELFWRQARRVGRAACSHSRPHSRRPDRRSRWSRRRTGERCSSPSPRRIAVDVAAAHSLYEGGMVRPPPLRPRCRRPTIVFAIVPVIIWV